PISGPCERCPAAPLVFQSISSERPVRVVPARLALQDRQSAVAGLKRLARGAVLALELPSLQTRLIDPHLVPLADVADVLRLTGDCIPDCSRGNPLAVLLIALPHRDTNLGETALSALVVRGELTV